MPELQSRIYTRCTVIYIIFALNFFNKRIEDAFSIATEMANTSTIMKESVNIAILVVPLVKNKGPDACNVPPDSLN